MDRYVHITDDPLLKAVHQSESAYTEQIRKKGVSPFRSNPETL